MQMILLHREVNDADASRLDVSQSPSQPKRNVNGRPSRTNIALPMRHPRTPQGFSASTLPSAPSLPKAKCQLSAHLIERTLSQFARQIFIFKRTKLDLHSEQREHP